MNELKPVGTKCELTKAKFQYWDNTPVTGVIAGYTDLGSETYYVFTIIGPESCYTIRGISGATVSCLVVHPDNLLFE